ncbi:MAG: hypothetical protein AMXMBFR34_07040 [Myxococcaceae bacterium]
MATVYLKGRAWYGGYKTHSGGWRYVRLSATTKTEAKRLANELEQKAERQRLGLDPKPDDGALTLAGLCEWWLKNRCPVGRVYNERKRLQRHVLGAALGNISLRELTADHIEEQLRAMEKTGLKPRTINGLRGSLNTVFRKARKAKKWLGENPVVDVEPRAVPEAIRPTLKAGEVAGLLAEVPSDWRDLFAAALYTGFRKGELFGLKKTDVDFELGVITVSRSYDQPTTKGRHADIIPIAGPLKPVLVAACNRSKSEYVFPDAHGRMRSPEADPQKVLRHALARAGLIDAYEHICRRCKANGKAHVERHTDAELRRCPVCKMKLWPRAIPRPMRFHDLRHTTATLLLRAGVDLHRVQRILRHRDVKLTTDTYGHLEVEDLRAAVNTLPVVTLVEVAEPVAVNSRPTSAPLTTRLLPESSGPKTKPRSRRISPTTPGPSPVGETGFEPATPWSRTKCSTRLSHSPVMRGPPTEWPQQCQRNAVNDADHDGVPLRS